MRRAAAAALCLLLGACTEPGGREAAPEETVRFATEDGVELVGELHGDGGVGVILLHMFPSDRASWSSFAEQLADEGYTALSFDFRGYGDSGGDRVIAEIWRDALAAVRFMRGRGFERIVLVGASMGGTAALIVAAREDLEAVVTLSAASSFMGLSIPPEAVELIDEPKLFVASLGDGPAAVTAQQFYALAPSPKRVEVVNGSDHGIELVEGERAQAVRRLVLEFLSEA
jgi:pimeloyl-ACP methyl ester carboxylesterase